LTDTIPAAFVLWKFHFAELRTDMDCLPENWKTHINNNHNIYTIIFKFHLIKYMIRIRLALGLRVRVRDFFH